MSRHEPDGPSAIVIGAGLSGLAAARALQARGVSVRIFEKAPRPADAWRRRHPRLRLNTHRWLSSLPGLPMPRSAGSFPSRNAVIRYLEAYAAHIDVPLYPDITVQRIDPSGGNWRIETDAGTFQTDHVIVATGRDRVPYIPRWPGSEVYHGAIRHAADLGEPEGYREARVLVVGAGNSGTDVLNHLSGVDTARLWVSVRHGPVVFPTRLLGLPVQLLSPLLERLPAPVVDRLLNLTERIAFGDLARLGLRKHRAGGATRLLEDGTAPAIDNGFIAALKAGRAEIVPAIESFSREHVRLADGRLLDPDVIICATGYRTGLERVVGHLGILDSRGVPAIDGAEQDPRYPGLWFIGMRPGLSGFFLAARRNAARIAGALDGVSVGKGEPRTRGTVAAEAMERA